MRVLWTVLVLSLFSQLFAQDNETCFDCHNDSEMTMTKGKKEISLYVSPEKFVKSAHGDMECVDCHVNFDPDEDPHLDKILPVNCAECHDDAAETFKHSQHSGKINCTSCHTNVHYPETKSKQVSGCENCHKDEKKQTAESIHNQHKKGPSCVSCHEPHNGLDVVSENCLKCHGQKEFVHDNIVHKDNESIMKYSESIRYLNT